ncbi:MAG: hypothetical protein CMQ44_04925 [Gammaproteobacteria bacterium]|nr:hypothetical protein [Gammaproteobacteria bacterium]
MLAIYRLHCLQGGGWWQVHEQGGHGFATTCWIDEAPIKLIPWQRVQALEQRRSARLPAEPRGRKDRL